MGMTKEIISILKKIKQEELFINNNAALDIGSQDIVGLNFQEYTELIEYEDNVAKTEFEKKRVSTKIIYDYLGFSDYMSIDLDEHIYSLKYDLNEPITEINKQFSLIYNGGTSEHIFNQSMLFENIHNLCEKDGLMLHLVPSQGSFEHGFFCYHPYLFFKMAQINNYSIEGVWGFDIINDCCEPLDLTYEHMYNNFSMDVKDGDNSVILLIVLMRKNTNELFKIPNHKYFVPDKAYWKTEIITDFYLQNIFENCKKIAIFGCGEAGQIAYDCVKRSKVDIVCFIDDYKQGNFCNQAIYTRESFAKTFAGEVDTIILGPHQKGIEFLDFKQQKLIDLTNFLVMK